MHLSAMKDIEMKIHNQLTKFEIVETEASLRSYLLYPFRVIIYSNTKEIEDEEGEITFPTTERVVLL